MAAASRGQSDGVMIGWRGALQAHSNVCDCWKKIYLWMSLCDRYCASSELGGCESGEMGAGLGSAEAVTAYNSHSLRLRDCTVALYIKC